MKGRAFLIASAVCLSACLPAIAADVVGTWIAPDPNPYLPEGRHAVPYPNSDAFTERIVFTHQNGTLAGTFVKVAGNEPLSDLKVSGSSISFSQGRNSFHGEIRGNQLHLLAKWDGAQTAQPYNCVKATDADLKIIQQEPTYDFTRLPLPSLHNVPSNGLARTPPMGVGNFPESSDASVRAAADQMVSSGLRDAGYVYLQVDEGWQGRRDAQGNIHPNARFPDMKALAGYVHSKGLKFGLYSSPGPAACWLYAGSYGHEEQDAKTYAEWGVDYLKYDWCTAGYIYHSQPEMQAAYQKMGDALQASGRPIVFSLCQYGLFDVTKWGARVGGNLWRTTGDIGDRWKTLSSNGFDNNGKLDHAGAGGWNDPDDLQTGIGGMTTEEYRTQMALWSIMAAPLMIEINLNDISRWSEETKAIPLNREVIAVDQDPLGIEGHSIFKQGQVEAWLKPLSDGTTAIALFNRSSEKQVVTIPWDDLHIKNVKSVRDLWRKTDLDNSTAGYHGAIPPHGSVLIKVSTVQ